MITIENLATHTSGLPEFPGITVHPSIPQKQEFKIQSNTEKI
jgi:CubicO group peptidase (beta-lactamase class C family)